MKSPARIAACLLPFLLAGCIHKKQTSHLQPYALPPSTAPQPTVATIELPPASAAIPTQSLASDTDSQLQAPKPPVKHKKSKKNAPQTGDTTQAANGGPQTPAEPSEVSAIGQLSSGDSSDLRGQTVDSITTTERGLNGIGRTLNDQEQKTATQIREYLKQARDALASGDVDGAHTLAAKAKVLLSELSGA
jgi:hypothetical protein